MLTALVVACAYPAVPVKADPEDDYLDELARAFRENEDEDAFAFRSGGRRLLRGTGSGSLPEAYSLTDPNGDGSVSYVTPVKCQNPHGTCWGFSAIAAAETSLISSGLADSSLDLSEKHTAFFNYRQILDNDNSQNGEGFVFKGTKGSSDLFNTGGFSFYATGLFASGTGPVKESRNVQFEYHGKNKLHNSREYLASDDWWIDDDLRWVQDYVLLESHILPDPSKCLKKDDRTGFKNAVKAMKEEIHAGRGLQIGYKSSNALPGQPNNEDYFYQANWAHYTYDRNTGADHQVTIIGWDDHYPKENFVHDLSGGRKSPAPAENGAWLVKNSWGSDEREFPDKGDWGLRKGQETGVYDEYADKWEYSAESDDAPHTGYFWLSYEDLSIDVIESVIFEKAKIDDYFIAQYDFLPVTNVNAAFTDAVVKTANVFKVGEFTKGKPAYVNAVSCQTVTPGTVVDYEIYKLRKNYTTPVDGELISSKTGVSYTYGGFHKEALSTPVLLDENDVFSVVVTQKTPDNKYALSIQKNSAPGEKFNAVAVVNSKESWFVMGSGTWTDEDANLSSNQNTFNLKEGEVADNFPIKAFLMPAHSSGLNDDPEWLKEDPRPRSITYDGTEQALVTAGSVEGEGAKILYGVVGQDGKVVYSEDIPTAKNAGDYRIYYKVTVNGELKLWDEFEASIKKKTLSIGWSGDSSHTYDGNTFGPVLTVTGICGSDDVDADVDNATAKDAGDYEAVIKALKGADKDNYALPENGLRSSYSITKRNVTLTSKDVDSAYTGSAVTDTNVDVTGDGFASGEGVTFNVTGSRTAPGHSPNTFTYTFNEGTSASNYNITEKVGTITVGWWGEDKVDEHIITVTAKDGNAVYNGDTQRITGLVDGWDSHTIEGVDYSVSGLSAEGSGVNVGTYPVTISGSAEVRNDNRDAVTDHFHIETVSGTLTITPRDISDATVSLEGELIYNGSEQIQAITVYAGGRRLTENTDYSVSGNKATASGEHTLTVTGKGNYKGSVSKKYTIIDPELTGVSASAKESLTYNGNSQIADVTTKADQSGVTFKYSREKDGSFTAGVPSFKDAGEHTVYYKAEKDGYQPKTGSFKVTIKKVVIGITWRNTSFTYDGDSHVPKATATNVKGDDSLTLDVSGSASSVGTHTAEVTGISGDGAGNYKLPSDVTKTFQINKSSNGSSSGSSTNTTTNTNTSTNTGSNTTNTGRNTTNTGNTANTGKNTTVNTGNTTNSGKNSTGSKSQSTGADNASKTDDNKSADTKPDDNKGSDKKKDSASDKKTKEIVEGTKLFDNEAALKAILGEDKFNELKKSGELPKVRLDVSALDPVPANDKKITEDTIKENNTQYPNLKVGAFLDLSLQMGSGDAWENVKSSKDPVRVVVRASSDIVKKAASMFVLRIHDDKTEILNDLDNDPETVTVDTGDFSTYVLLYQEKEKEEESKAPDNITVTPKEDSNDTGEAESVDTPVTVSAPDTGVQSVDEEDSDMWRVWVLGAVLVLIIGGVIALAVVTSKK